MENKESYIMKMFKYTYVLSGKERNLNTGTHPISIHFTRLGAIIAFLRAIPHYTKLSITSYLYFS